MSTNDASHAKETLTCRGHVLVPCHLDPQRVRFGTIPAGVATQYRTVTIMRGDGGPIAPEIVLPEDSPGLDAHICEIESGEYYELVISVGPPWQARRLRELLYLKTGVEEVPEVRIFVTGTVSSP